MQFKWPVWITLGLGLAGGIAYYQYQQDQQQALWRQMIGQKLMLDIRFYCPEPEFAGDGTPADCTSAVTELPEALAEMIAKQHIGGVVLFAQNLHDPVQIRTLTAQLQQSRSGDIPLLIATDQEGGQVARLPEEAAPAFAGNMALGATFAQWGIDLAREVGRAQARQLSYFGINVNFAPTMDVNSNPANPVINVRSFGDDPQQVSKLGIALSQGLQEGGVAATLKHFPGHGDTQTDSHLGLARVNHDLAQAKQTDLAPFANAFHTLSADLVMTAHIQYPALDQSEIVTRDGSMLLKPATLSREILHNLLRQQLGFEGVVITDALDMGAVSQYFTPEQLVIGTFAAGADIALMPVAIQGPADIPRLQRLIAAVATALQKGQLDQQEFTESYQRVLKLKQKFPGLVVNDTDRQDQLEQEQQLELLIARSAVTVVQGAPLIPLSLFQPMAMLMPDPQKCQQFQLAIAMRGRDPSDISCRHALQTSQRAANYAPGTLVLAAYIAPEQSAAELGVMADMLARSVPPQSVRLQLQWLEQELHTAKNAGATVVLMALRTPYQLPQFQALSDIQLTSYGYQVAWRNDLKLGPSYQALLEVLTGEQPATGQLPVQLPVTPAEAALAGE